jgi:hypothetical protein
VIWTSSDSIRNTFRSCRRSAYLNVSVALGLKFLAQVIIATVARFMNSVSVKGSVPARPSSDRTRFGTGYIKTTAFLTIFFPVSVWAAVSVNREERCKAASCAYGHDLTESNCSITDEVASVQDDGGTLASHCGTGEDADSSLV